MPRASNKGAKAKDVESDSTSDEKPAETRRSTRKRSPPEQDANDPSFLKARIKEQEEYIATLVKDLANARRSKTNADKKIAGLSERVKSLEEVNNVLYENTQAMIRVFDSIYGPPQTTPPASEEVDETQGTTEEGA